MPSKDPRITAYVAAAAPFARPILREIRAAMHQGCPAVEETLKWGMPTFVHHGIIGGMGAFKAHCSLWLWRGFRLPSLGPGKGGAMGQFGRLGAAADLPPRAHLVRLVQEAAALNQARAAAPGGRKAPRSGKARKTSRPAAAKRRTKGGQAPARKGQRTA